MDIAVVGSGIGGLASAIFLARSGHRITVYERAARPQPVGAGFLLQPPGQRVLQKLGLAEQVSRDAAVITGLKSKTIRGKVLLDLKYQDIGSGNLVGWGIQRNNIFDALYSAASEHSGIEFKWGSTVSNLRNQKDHLALNFQDQTQQHELCILSAGTHSDLADQLFANRLKVKYPWGCLWTTITLPKDFCTDVLQQRCHNASKMMGVLPVQCNGETTEAALYWSMPVSRFDCFDAAGSDAIKEEMTTLWPELRNPIQALVYEDLKCASYNDVWTPQPINRRIIALGDICHGTSPQLGQGCTMALLDAISLSSSLSKRGDQVDLALDDWWVSRRKQLAYVRLMSRMLTPLYQSDKRIFDLFRDYLMAPLGRLPGLYQLQLKTLSSHLFLDDSVL